MRTFVTHLECSATQRRYAADRLVNLSDAGKPLLVRYDLAAIRRCLSKETLRNREPSMWRYRELLPVRHESSITSLGESMTPIVRLPSAGARLGLAELMVKDEAQLPTGSFKARGLAIAVSMAREFGVTDIAMPTNGNAGAALAAYATRAGMRSFVFCPDVTPEVNVREMALAGANVYKVSGMIDDCGKLVTRGETERGWFNCSTLKEPYRIEGKKTMGLELAEQLDWVLPDAIFFPTGGGTAVIGMWKAFAEMEALGWIDSRRPRMFAVQADGCAPIVRAYDQGEEQATRWNNASTCASGIRVPSAVGDFLILQVLRQSGGAALSVSEEQIVAARERLGAQEGFLLCPEAAAAFAAIDTAVARGLIRRDHRVLFFNCASAQKYALPPGGRLLDPACPVDLATLN